MTFDELKQIKDDATRQANSAGSAKRSAQSVRDNRLNLPATDDIIIPFKTSWNGISQPLTYEAQEAVKQAVFDMLPDILRLAEMRLEAVQKHHAARAKALEAQLSAYLGEQP